jgi:hypothetical protein
MFVQAGEPDREICRRVASDLPSAGHLGRPGRPCGRLTGTRPWAGTSTFHNPCSSCSRRYTQSSCHWRSWNHAGNHQRRRRRPWDRRWQVRRRC